MNTYQFGACNCCDPVINSVVETESGGHNIITIDFDECSPTPENGYNVFYRKFGTSDALINGGNFTSSPAVITDTHYVLGTFYSGYIQSDCGFSVGTQVPFDTAPTIGMDNSPSCRSEGTCNDNSTCGIRYTVTTTNAPAGSFIVVTNISGSATISVIDSDPASGLLQYIEPNAAGTVTFDLLLKDSGGITIASQLGITITHESFYEFLSSCGG